MTYNYIEDYLKEKLAKGRYLVTFQELKNQFGASEKAILQNIFRLKQKNRLAQVRKEFYVIIPPQYSTRGMLPPTLFISDMMEFLNREYYVGLFSAAALHGAGHQQPMEFQVITGKPPLRNIKKQKLKISFFTKSSWESAQLTEKKTETGYLKLSSPELTAFDLVKYHKRIGGLNRIVPILDELTELIKLSKLTKTAKIQRKSTIQRLGYLFDVIDKEPLANSLIRFINNKSKEIPLSLAHKVKSSPVNDKWKVKVNIKIEQ